VKSLHWLGESPSHFDRESKFMAYAINHVHIRSADPRASASWYEMHFGAKIVSEREVMPGTVTMSLDTKKRPPGDKSNAARR